MPRLVDPAHVEPVVAGLLGAITVADGPTPEQLAVLRAVVAHLWERPDLEPTTLVPLDPEATAAAVPDPAARRRFHEVLMTLEACRHPLSAAVVDRCEEYLATLGVDGPDVAIFRSHVAEGHARAHADFDRFLMGSIADRHEASLDAEAPGTPEPELAARVAAFADLAPDSLGRAFLAFYERHGIALPGTTASPLNHFFVAHDMTHVIAGIEPTAAGEIALSAFSMAMDDTPVNVGALFASLVVHEAGFGDTPTFGHETGILATPGAAEVLASSLARGARCTGDCSVADHFALAPLPLPAVRARFGVPAPADPHDGHHHW